MTQNKRIAFLLKNLEAGGIERVVLNLLKPLAKRDDISIDLVVASATGPYLEQVPAGVRLINLQIIIENRSKSYIKLIPLIANYLRTEKPDFLWSHLPIANGLSVIAKNGARVPVSLFLVEHTLLFNSLLQKEQKRFLNSQKRLELLPTLLPIMMRWLYPQANGVITVSRGMAKELEEGLKLKQGLVKTIYNPVIDEDLLLKSYAPLEHPWFQPNQPPVMLAVGRLTAQKDYPTLLRAFASFRKQHPARLLILGEGELRPQLETLIDELDLEADVSLPGFVSNPYAYMRRAAALILSSLWEGLPTVLIEAIACGCQVISTDCTYGPDEILEQGKYGCLVPVGDVSALADAMHQVLHSQINPDDLVRRAQDFQIERAVLEYLKIMNLNQGYLPSNI